MVVIMKNSVGSFEAKTHFTQLIERASKGEEIIITKREKPIAKIVPLEKIPTLKTQQAIERLKSLANELKLGVFDWTEWQKYRDIGRK